MIAEAVERAKVYHCTSPSVGRYPIPLHRRPIPYASGESFQRGNPLRRGDGLRLRHITCERAELHNSLHQTSVILIGQSGNSAGERGRFAGISILKPDSDSHHWQAGLQKAKFEPGFESEPLPTQPSLVLTGRRK